MATKTATKVNPSPASSALTPVNPQTMVKQGSLDASMLADAGAGFEEATREAYAIPFLRILQDLSPQVKAKMSGYIKDAKAGQIFNTVSQALFNDITVIPCHFTQCYIEWTPRTKGGGFVARYDLASGATRMGQTVRDKARNILPNGNELMDTREHYVLVVHPDGSSEGALIAMTSTSLKISRRWMTVIRSPMPTANGRMIERPPMFASAYTFTSEEEANDQGSWFQWHIGERQRVTDLALYEKAKAFHLAMKSGMGRVNYEELAAQRADDRAPQDLHNEIDA